MGINREQLVRQYEALYPDDDDAYGNDFWIVSGYEQGLLDWIEDVWEAFQKPEICSRLSSTNAMNLRRFARAYEMGVSDRPVIVRSTARKVAARLP